MHAAVVLLLNDLSVWMQLLSLIFFEVFLFIILNYRLDFHCKPTVSNNFLD